MRGSGSGVDQGSERSLCRDLPVEWCTFDYNSYQISSPELQDLFLVELVTLLFEALFSFLIPNSQHTLRRWPSMRSSNLKWIFPGVELTWKLMLTAMMT